MFSKKKLKIFENKFNNILLYIKNYSITLTIKMIEIIL